MVTLPLAVYIVLFRIQGKEMELHQRTFRMDIWKRFFTVKVTDHWTRLRREVVTAPSLSELKKYLENT